MTFCTRHKTIPPKDKWATTNNSTQQQQLWLTLTNTLGASLTQIGMIGGEETITLVEDPPQHRGTIGSVLIKKVELCCHIGCLLFCVSTSPIQIPQDMRSRFRQDGQCTGHFSPDQTPNSGLHIAGYCRHGEHPRVCKDHKRISISIMIPNKVFPKR